MTYKWTKYILAAGFFCGVIAASNTQAQETAGGSAIVTAVPKSKENLTTIPKQAVTVSVDGKPGTVSGWAPFRGDRSGLQLAVLIDDSAGSSLGLQLQDIKNFINSLPPTVQVAVAYMRNGSANMAQTFTANHEAAAKALRVPAGFPGGNGSPYFCLQDLIKHWPQGGAVRREVIMVTGGVDPYQGRGYNPDDPYLAAAIRDAQKGDVIVYSIYFRDIGRGNRGYTAFGGQNYLIQLSDATGGEAYYQGFGNPVSFQPFLSDIWGKLQNQYELRFTSAPKKGLVRFNVKTSQPNTKLLAPTRVPVMARAAD